jgi:probable F420-dependent oxidoreductase
MSVKVGIALTPAEFPLAPLIEELGFDSVWGGEHLLFHVPTFDVLTSLGYLAGATNSIAIGTSVLLLPLQHPLHAAKSLVTAENLSGGRVIAGVGVGGEYPPEFDAVGVPMSERGSRCDEGIELMRRLWTEHDVTHNGRFYHLNGVTIDPWPLRPGGPPVWIGGRSEAAAHRAARLGDGFLPYLIDADGYKIRREYILAERAQSPLADRPLTFGLFAFATLGPDLQVARQEAAAAVGRNYQMDMSRAMERYGICGDPETIAQTIHRYRDSGVKHFVLNLVGGDREGAKRYTAFARQVLPLLRV